MQRSLQENITARLFCLIRRYDVELAEDLLRRSPSDITTISELNKFFIELQAAYPKATRPQLALPATENLEDWLRGFEVSVLPTLRKLRLPPYTARTEHPFYAASMAFFPHKSTAVA